MRLMLRRTLFALSLADLCFEVCKLHGLMILNSAK